jgi:hypothetical protein
MAKRCDACQFSQPGTPDSGDLFCVLNPPQVIFAGRDGQGRPIILSRYPNVAPGARCACFTAESGDG